MSCKKCDKAQDEGIGYFLRIDGANVKIIACVEHFQQIQAIVRADIAQDLMSVQEVWYFVKNGVAHIQNRIDLSLSGQERQSECGRAGILVTEGEKYTAEQVVSDNRLLCRYCMEKAGSNGN